MSQTVSFRFNKGEKELEKKYLNIPKTYRTDTVKRALSNELLNKNNNDTALIELNKKLDSIDNSLKTLVNILSNTSIKAINIDDKNTTKAPNTVTDDKTNIEKEQDNFDKQAFLNGMKSFAKSVNT
ncbi:hypothetical protein [Clostridium sporogenes]|uniref:hypothetical protein n=1 Tax=Clostridium sporogenes TaxID=1509 RepID=UPI0006B27C75|nr:hypothetical protein [Clostridium sporogenes]KOY66065.1 hypothetical protein AN649_09625 [Clostridium sporogenes]MDS1006515.1 hypothetical protein [Clostridium sporogenes]